MNPPVKGLMKQILLSVVFGDKLEKLPKIIFISFSLFGRMGNIQNLRGF